MVELTRCHIRNRNFHLGEWTIVFTAISRSKTQIHHETE